MLLRLRVSRSRASLFLLCAACTVRAAWADDVPNASATSAIRSYAFGQTDTATGLAFGIANFAPSVPARSRLRVLVDLRNSRAARSLKFNLGWIEIQAVDASGHRVEFVQGPSVIGSTARHPRSLDSGEEYQFSTKMFADPPGTYQITAIAHVFDENRSRQVTAVSSGTVPLTITTPAP